MMTWLRNILLAVLMTMAAGRAAAADDLVPYRRPSYEAMAIGAGIFTVSYVSYAVLERRDSWQPMIPLVGPLLVGDRLLREAGSCPLGICELERHDKFQRGVRSIFDGVAQIIGVSVVIGGALIREQLWRKAESRVASAHQPHFCVLVCSASQVMSGW